MKLNCPNCGGVLEVEEKDFLKFGEVVIQTCDFYQCKYCGTKTERSKQFTISIEHADIGVQVNTEGGAYIKGKVTVLGNFVGRDKVVNIHTSH
jgi:C4-type Zn-finger protein